MDIFDTFFLVEYLRQWAARGRIVVSIRRGLRSSNAWWLTSPCPYTGADHTPAHIRDLHHDQQGIYLHIYTVISTQSYLHIYTVISTYLSVSTQVALLSLGRLMYFGKRREMLPYFAFIEYPCPAYKNPADYYREYPHTIQSTPT